LAYKNKWGHIQDYWGQAPFFNNDAKKGAKQKMGPGPINSDKQEMQRKE
jgi:hypothetical protein